MSIAALAISDGRLESLLEELAWASSDPDCRVITLTGFDRAQGPVEPALLAALDDCPVPLIAALGGDVMSAGLLLAAACDMAVAARDATLSLADMDGDHAGAVGRLARFLPGGLVRRMILTGEPVPVADAARLGAVQLDDGQGLAMAVDQLARELGAKSPSAIRLLKQSMASTAAMPTTAGLELEALYSRIAAVTPDGREAARAFLEKRAAVWAALPTGGGADG